MTDKNKDESIIVLSTNAFEELMAYARIGCEEAGCPEKANSLHKHARKRNTWLRDKHMQDTQEARRNYANLKQQVKQFVGAHGGTTVYMRYDEFVVIPVKVLAVYLPNRVKIRVKEHGFNGREQLVDLNQLTITKPAGTWTPMELAQLQWDSSKSRYRG